MTNNDVFKKLLQLTGLSLKQELTIEIFELGGINATSSKIKGWRTSLDNPRSSRMPDFVLSGFINGLFVYRDLKQKEGVRVFNF